jgi:hypothetical protein
VVPPPPSEEVAEVSLPAPPAAEFDVDVEPVPLDEVGMLTPLFELEPEPVDPVAVAPTDTLTPDVPPMVELPEEAFELLDAVPVVDPTP